MYMYSIHLIHKEKPLGHLVGGIPTLLRKYNSQLGVLFPIYGKQKHVPNYQAATL